EDARAARVGKDSGVVDEHVAAAVDFLQEQRQRSDAALARDVELVKLRPQLPGGGATFLLVARGQDDVHVPAPGELAGDLTANAAVRAGNDRDTRSSFLLTRHSTPALSGSSRQCHGRDSTS